MIQEQLAAVEALAEDLARQKDGDKDPAQGDASQSEDASWAKANLRFGAAGPFADIANAVRILERHSDFKGRFKYNETLAKVMDKGSVMLDWRIAEATAVIQERFLPEMPQAIVEKALVIVANRAIAKK